MHAFGPSYLWSLCLKTHFPPREPDDLLLHFLKVSIQTSLYQRSSLTPLDKMTNSLSSPSQHSFFPPPCFICLRSTYHRLTYLLAYWLIPSNNTSFTKAKNLSLSPGLRTYSLHRVCGWYVMAGWMNGTGNTSQRKLQKIWKTRKKYRCSQYNFRIGLKHWLPIQITLCPLRGRWEERYGEVERGRNGGWGILCCTNTRTPQ